MHLRCGTSSSLMLRALCRCFVCVCWLCAGCALVCAVSCVLMFCVVVCLPPAIAPYPCSLCWCWCDASAVGLSDDADHHSAQCNARTSIRPTHRHTHAHTHAHAHARDVHARLLHIMHQQHVADVRMLVGCGIVRIHRMRGKSSQTEPQQAHKHDASNSSRWYGNWHLTCTTRLLDAAGDSNVCGHLCRHKKHASDLRRLHNTNKAHTTHTGKKHSNPT